MPTIDKNRILGNYGANFVAHILSKFCLVRPVAEGTDIGVDLYCETIEGNEGFLHFWVQVKSGGQITINRNGKATCAFKSHHLRYWERQPIPVFAFYVPCDFPLKIPDRIYIANISSYLMISGVPLKGGKSIESDIKLNPKNDDWHEKFLAALKYTSSYIKLKEGIIGALPQLKPSYMKKFPYFLGLSQYAPEKTLQMIRTTVGILVFDAALLKHTKNIDPEMKFFERLIEILQIFEPGKRPEILKGLSLWAAVIDDDVEKATNLLNDAKQSIQSDRNLSQADKEVWLNEFIPIKHIIDVIKLKQKPL